jgi:hypothetical protein
LVPGIHPSACGQPDSAQRVAWFCSLLVGIAVALSLAPAAEGAPQPLEPASVFVTPKGSDANPCTRKRPCRSFDRAYHVASPGDTVNVAGGYYPSQTLSRKAHAAPPHVYIRETPGARVIVGNPGAENNCLGFDGAQYVTVRGVATRYTTVGGQRHQCGVSIGRGNAHHVTLIGVNAGMIWFGADNVRVFGGDFGPGIDENTKIEFATGHAPRNILIQGARIHDARMHREHQECIALWGGTGITIRNSHIYNCAVFHLWIVAGRGETIRNIRIENNLFTQPGPRRPHISSTIKVGDHGGRLAKIVLRGNRVLVDEMYIVQGYDEGGIGDIHLLGNRVAEPITLGSRQNCMRMRTYRPKPGVVFQCGLNRLVRR